MTELAGRAILLVEDEPLIALMAETMLQQLGCAMVGPAATLEEGLALAQGGTYDGAMLDVNLKGKRSDAIGAVLRERRVPFVLATGYGDTIIEAGTADVILEKPYQLADLDRALRRIFAGR